MAQHNDLGALGETEALLYLQQKGYRLLDRNWRSGHLEIDIVAEWYGEIVFVEVKTRTDEHFAPAAEAVNHAKRLHLIAAAKAYLLQHHLTEQVYAFDIITVVGKQRPFCITHIQNAYTEAGVKHIDRHRYDGLSTV